VSSRITEKTLGMPAVGVVLSVMNDPAELMD
jgi:hypothetical protein